MHPLPTFAEPDGLRTPCRMDGRSTGYLVLDGEADLFALRRRPGGGLSRRHFVARVPAGALVPGISAIGVWQLVLVPLPGTRLHPVSGRARFSATPITTGPEAVQLTAALDRALLAVADAIRRGQPPREAQTVQPGEVLSLAAGGVLTGPSEVWWLRVAGGRLCRVDDGGPEQADDLVLLAGRDWVVAEQACVVENLTSAALLADGGLWPAVDRCLVRLLGTIERRVEQADAAVLDTVRRRKRADAAVVASAARQAVGVIGAPDGLLRDPRSRSDPYQKAAAVLRVALADDATGVCEPADRSRAPKDEQDALAAVARASGLHLRQVRLPKRWWRQDLGPLVGWLPDGDGRIAVPLRFAGGRYHTVDAETRARSPLDPAGAAGFGEAATQVQLPLPPRADLRTLWWQSVRGSTTDLRALLLASCLVAVLGLGTPIVTGVVLGRLTREGTLAGLTGFLALLLTAAAVAAAAGVAQNLRLLRLEGRVETGAQLAVWDRVMRLPVHFFARSSTGELANAVLGISFVREALGGLLPNALAAVLTALASLVLLLIVQPTIGAVAVVLILLVTVVCAVLARLIVRRERPALHAEHRAAALTNQLLTGVAKIKITGAEDRAYARWTRTAAAARGLLQHVRHLQAVLVGLATVLPIGGQLVLFTLLAGPLAGRVDPQQFFVVNACFMTLLGSLLILVSTSVEVTVAVPRLEALHDVLATEPERRPDLLDPGELTGEIALHRVTFGYRPEDPPVLADVDLLVRPGEFVAVVGPSGSGKSTLLRLLLGFERPSVGAVLYDGQDLAELDVTAVRRQCGVVLQDGQLFAGTIRDNICGAGSYTFDEVWEAARMAGLADDLERLPMGLSTMVPYGGGTLSVGQRQRVLIARALVHRPRVLLFDEATSALDNATQQVVTASTERLAASRLVIAHRLSTVMNADRIIVLDAGRIVQSGTFAELMAQPDGMFQRLARRQMLTLPAAS